MAASISAGFVIPLRAITTSVALNQKKATIFYREFSVDVRLAFAHSFKGKAYSFFPARVR